MNITEAIRVHTRAKPEIRFDPHGQPAYEQRREDGDRPRQKEYQEAMHAKVMRQSQNTGKGPCRT